MFSTENGISDMFSKIGNVSGADMLAGEEPINQLCIFLLACMVYFVKDEKNRFALFFVRLYLKYIHT